MLVYTATIAISCVFFALSERLRIKGRPSFLSVIFVVFAIGVPCFVAGARDPGVGTDTLGYAEWLFNLANGIDNYRTYLVSSMTGPYTMDFLFAATVYFPARLGIDHFSYYFSIELLMLLPAFAAFRILCCNQRFWFLFLIYYLIFYIMGLNLMRQGIALSFVMLSVALIIKQNRIKSLAAFLTAILFHKSAIIALAFFAIGILILKKISTNTVYRKWALLSAIAVMCMCLFVSSYAIELIELVSVWLPSFAGYADTSKWAVDSGASYYFFFGLALLLSIAFMKERMGGMTPLGVVCSIIVALSFVFQSLGVISSPVTRLAYYSVMFLVPLLSLPLCVEEKLRTQDWLILVVLSVNCATQMFWAEGVRDMAGASVYTSMLLGIL